MRLSMATCIPFAVFLSLSATLGGEEAGSRHPLVIVNPYCQPAKAAQSGEEGATVAAQPRKSAARANHVLDENERGMLRIFDQVVSRGLLPAESLAGARQIILSGERDAHSLAHVVVAGAYCMALLTDNEQKRAEYLRIARDTHAAEVARLKKGVPPEERLRSFAQQIQEGDPRSLENQERMAEISEIMKGIMDKRHALTAELQRQAEEAKRKVAETEERIAVLKKRMKERQQRAAAQGH